MPHGTPYRLSDAQLLSATALILGYHDATATFVIEELDARFRRAHARHAAAGRLCATEVFGGLLAWLDQHGGDISST